MQFSIKWGFESDFQGNNHNSEDQKAVMDAFQTIKDKVDENENSKIRVNLAAAVHVLEFYFKNS